MARKGTSMPRRRSSAAKASMKMPDPGPAHPLRHAPHNRAGCIAAHHGASNLKPSPTCCCKRSATEAASSLHARRAASPPAPGGSSCRRPRWRWKPRAAISGQGICQTPTPASWHSASSGKFIAGKTGGAPVAHILVDDAVDHRDETTSAAIARPLRPQAPAERAEQPGNEGLAHWGATFSPAITGNGSQFSGGGSGQVAKGVKAQGGL